MLLSVNKHEKNTGWLSHNNTLTKNKKRDQINLCPPLKVLLGFAVHYTGIITNVTQELIPLRTSTTSTSVTTNAADGKLELTAG